MGEFCRGGKVRFFFSLNLSVDLTCVDELDVSLQVAVDHENLVAARMRAGSLSHFFVMLLDVLLKTQLFIQSKAEHTETSHRCPILTSHSL